MNLLLNVHNQEAFDSLENHYLYDIPLFIEEEETGRCTCCGQSFSKEELSSIWDGNTYCINCLLFTEGDITREELKELYEIYKK